MVVHGNAWLSGLSGCEGWVGGPRHPWAGLLCSCSVLRSSRAIHTYLSCSGNADVDCCCIICRMPAEQRQHEGHVPGLDQVGGCCQLQTTGLLGSVIVCRLYWDLRSTIAAFAVHHIWGYAAYIARVAPAGVATTGIQASNQVCVLLLRYFNKTYNSEAEVRCLHVNKPLLATQSAGGSIMLSIPIQMLIHSYSGSDAHGTAMTLPSSSLLFSKQDIQQLHTLCQLKHKFHVGLACAEYGTMHNNNNDNNTMHGVMGSCQ